MKNILYKLNILAALILLVSCEKEGSVAHNDENTLSDVWLTIQGEKDVRFDPEYREANTVVFNIPYFYPEGSDHEVDLENLILRANIPLDSRMSPALGTPMDLSEPLEIDVISGTGEVNPYRIEVNRVADLSIKQISIEIETVEGVQTIEGIQKNEEIVFYALPEIDLSNAILTLQLDNHSTSSIPSGSQIDLSEPVALTVTGVDGSTKDYTLVAQMPEKLDYGMGITKMLWNKPGSEFGFGAHIETGLAVSGDYLVITTRSRPSVYKIYDRYTGEFQGEMSTPDFWSFQVTNDDAGHLLGATFTLPGKDFLVYKWEDPFSDPEPFIEFTTTDTQLGRSVNIKGDLDGDAVIMATVSASNRIAKWIVEDGVLQNQTPEFITYEDVVDGPWPNLVDAQPISAERDADYFINYAEEIAYVNGETNRRVYSFSDETAVVGTYHAPTDYFTLNGANYLAIVEYSKGTSGARASIFDVTDPSQIGTASSDPGFDEFKVFTSVDVTPANPSNPNGTSDVEVVVSEDGETAWLYLLLTNGGVLAYELTAFDPN